MKKYGKGCPIFVWACFGMKLGEGATSLGRVQDLLDSSPNLLHANKKGSISHFCACKRSEKEFSMLRGLGAWFLSWKRGGESSLLGSAQNLVFWGFYLRIWKKKKIIKKIVSSLSFFHLFISSRSPSSTSKKVSKIWRKNPVQPRRKSSHELALSRRPIRSELRVNFL